VGRARYKTTRQLGGRRPKPGCGSLQERQQTFERRARAGMECKSCETACRRGTTGCGSVVSFPSSNGWPDPALLDMPFNCLMSTSDSLTALSRAALFVPLTALVQMGPRDGQEHTLRSRVPCDQLERHSKVAALTRHILPFSATLNFFVACHLQAHICAISTVTACGPAAMERVEMFGQLSYR
jgi:hypothetical protein